MPRQYELQFNGKPACKLIIYNLTPEVLTGIKGMIAQLEYDVTGEILPSFGLPKDSK